MLAGFDAQDAGDVLLDEPLGALDAKLREEMQVELIALQRAVGITFVLVTHSQQEALAEIAATDPRPLKPGERGAFALRPELIRVYGRQESADLKNRFAGRVKFHEVGDAVAVCWRHDAGVFLRA